MNPALRTTDDLYKIYPELKEMTDVLPSWTRRKIEKIAMCFYYAGCVDGAGFVGDIVKEMTMKEEGTWRQ